MNSYNLQVTAAQNDFKENRKLGENTSSEILPKQDIHYSCDFDTPFVALFDMRTSIILVWHIHAFDLTILRELSASVGYDYILPPKENCIPMIRHYRAGLPTKNKFNRY
ncbi:hypothetical protein GGI43DRAFT_407114 [Trichoderma evansii]